MTRVPPAGVRWKSSEPPARRTTWWERTRPRPEAERWRKEPGVAARVRMWSSCSAEMPGPWSWIEKEKALGEAEFETVMREPRWE